MRYATSSLSRQSPRLGIDANLAVRLLTTYIVLLLALPSARTIAPLGSLGRPAILWGLLCFGYWCWVYLTAGPATVSRRQPMRVVLVLFLASMLISYVTAHAQGFLPADEASPSDTALLRSLSWAGVLLIANDGITGVDQLKKLVERIALATGLVALLGLTQFFSGDSIIDRIPIPGLTYDPSVSAIGVRSGFLRAVSTASQPLEYAVVLSAGLPLAIAVASLKGDQGSRLARWWPSAVLFLAAVMSVSKSAVLGLLVGLMVLLPGLPRRTRAWLGAGGVLLLAATYVLVPGMIGTVRGLFLSAGDDSSTDSRRGGVAAATEIAERFFPFGRGPGTFLPKYYVLDNELMLLLVEVGVVGLATFGLMVLTGIVQSQRARYSFGKTTSMGRLAQALTASLAATATLFAFFDALGFVMAAGVLFILLGLCGAAANVAADAQAGPSPKDAARPIPPEPLAQAAAEWRSDPAGPFEGEPSDGGPLALVTRPEPLDNDELGALEQVGGRYTGRHRLGG